MYVITHFYIYFETLNAVFLLFSGVCNVLTVAL